MTDVEVSSHSDLREYDEILHPSHKYTRPSDVLADSSLTGEQRRAILSAWASDACAVPSNPILRRPPFAPSPVAFDEIMDALRDLDRIDPILPVKRKVTRRFDTFHRPVG